MATDGPSVSPRRALLAGLSSSLVALLLVGLAGELWVRLGGPGIDYDLEMWRYARTGKQPSRAPRIGHEHRPGVREQLMGVPVATDEQGRRFDPEAPPIPSEARRLLILGDSITMGWGVAYPETFAGRLQTKLNEPGPPWYEIWNAGVGNYGTVQEVAAFHHRWLPQEPDAVLLAYFINDAEPVPVERTGLLRQRSHLFILLAARWDRLVRRIGGHGGDYREYYRGLYRPEQPAWQAVREALAHLAATCQARDLPLLVAVIPELHQPAEQYPFQEVHRAVLDQARSLGVPAVDLLPATAGADVRSLWVAPDDAHPNAEGHARLARELLRWIDPAAPLAGIFAPAEGSEPAR